MIKKILLIILLVGGAWIALNFDYFRKNIEYEFKKDDYQQNPAPAPQEKMEPDKLLVPSLNIEAPVLYAERNNEDYFQELLVNGVVHYPGTAEIGEPGNAYIFGHSSDNALSSGKYKTVFALLPRIAAGADIYISDREGNKYVYRVIESRAVEKDDLSVLDQGDRKRKLLTLQTSYPVGTSLKRYVVVGE